MKASMKQREIRSGLKSVQLVKEEEKPIRWPYMKVLREYSTLKQFYPSIDPYVEVYPVRDNVYALFSDSLDAHGDPWMYLIVGPRKAMLIDTSFGLGDLKSLVDHLSGGKELIVVNTHAHTDHAGGNGQFPVIWCHEYELEGEQGMNSTAYRDHFMDPETGKGKFAEFDPADLIDFKPFQIKTFSNHHEFDLGDGYIVEALHLPGHTAGMCAFYDHHNKILFEGDTTSCIARKGAPHPVYLTVEALHDALVSMKPLFTEIEGLFPGHGALDQSPILLQYLLDTTERIMKDPENYDYKTEPKFPGQHAVYMKCIYEGSAIRYIPELVYKKDAV
jgi:glyoxylase-like metal-dependent hydrolase (beta-lactamase superfamily II)